MNFRDSIILIIVGFLACALAGCKAEKPTQIVISIATDLNIPAEINQLGIKAEYQGEFPIDRKYELDPSVEGYLSLQGTLALNAGKDLAEPVLITVTGNQGGTEIVKRQARLKWVKDKVLLLHMNLLRNCAARPVPCPAEHTCTENGCESIDVDSSTLPEYTEEAAQIGLEAGVGPPSDGGLEDALTDLVSQDVTTCGNGNIDSGEECDGTQLGGQTCQSQGFDEGTLACDVNCKFDTIGCNYFGCGDGKITGNEDCEDSNIGSATCVSQGFDGGTLSCSSNCTFDTSSCHKCLDGKISGPEECDGSDLDGETCITLGHGGGTLLCTNTCAFDESGCYKCGDGTKNGSEQCEGSDLGGETCNSFLGADYTGTLKCNSNCTFDTTGCCNGCWDGSICSAGTSVNACGINGIICQTCTSSDQCKDATCSSGNCGEVVKNSGSCEGGTGTCREGSCCTGCWTGSACLPGTSNADCGSNGEHCAECLGGTSCINGTCL